MTVWIHVVDNGEFEQVATVENGEVVEGDSGILEGAFPEGIPEDEEEVARMFLAPPTIASTDFDMEFEQEPLEGVEASEGEEGNENLAAWEQTWLDLHQRTWDASADRNLLQFNDEEVPKFVVERLKDVIRGGAIFSHFETIPSSELMQLREYMVEELADGNWNIDGIANRLQDLDGELSFDDAERIARTETAAAVNTAREEGYQERGQAEGEVFKWVGSDDNRITDTCEWLLEKTNPKHGGTPVSLERLKELIEKAPEHDPDMADNMARPENYLPHINCRKTFVRVVE